MLLNLALFVALIETVCTPLGIRHNANGDLPAVYMYESHDNANINNYIASTIF